MRTHFIEKISDNEMVVERLDMLAVEVVVRNVAAGSIVRRLGVEKGTRFDPPHRRVLLKDDALHDPILTEEHIRAMGLATPEQVEQMKRDAPHGQRRDRGTFLERAQHGPRRLQARVRDEGRRMVLGDEISPDTCRFHDATTGEIMDKDRFRQDMGGFIDAYNEVLERVSS